VVFFIGIFKLMSVITIKDVAKQAGVGIGTVSRVLNNNPRVSIDTRERVLQAITDLNFRPNGLARRLPRKTELRHIGIISHPFTKNYHSLAERLRGIQSALQQHDSDLEIVLFAVSSPEHYDGQINSIVQNSDVLGVLILHLDLSDEQSQALRSSNIPFIGLNNFTGRDWTCIGVDDHEGGYIATKHLIELGHKRIAYIGDTMFDEYGFPTSQLRYGGYTQALTEANISINARYIRLAEHSYQNAYVSMNELLDLSQPPTAVFAMSDLQAMGAWMAIRERGLSVPKDISLMGYDDTEMSILAGLTTVRQHFDLSGQLAVKHLLTLIEHTGSASEAPKLPPTEVIIRHTTQAPKKRNGKGRGSQ
jgi:LacI family transcriptional regulator